MKKLLAILLFSSSGVFASEINLQDAIKSTYDSNPELKYYNYNVEATKSGQYKAYGGFLPKIYYDINRGDQNYKVADTQTVKGRADSENFTVSQDLFNGGSTIFDIQRVGSEIKKSQAQKDYREQSIFLEVIKSYVDILKIDELLINEIENIASQEKLLEYTKKKMTARDATKSEIAKSEADYNSAINNKKALENDLVNAKKIFTRLTGIEINADDKLKPLDEKFIAKNFSEENIEKLLQRAAENNPEVKSAKHSMESARYSSYMSKASLSPTVKFNYNVSENKNSVYLNNRSQRTESAFVNFHIPIFNSAVEFSNISEANNLLKGQKYNYDATNQRIRQQVQEYLNKISSLNVKYNSAKSQQEANEIYVETLAHEERLGTRSIVDLLIGKQYLYNAKTDRINLYYEKLYSYFELENLLGSLVYERLNSGSTINFDKEEKEILAEEIVERKFVSEKQTESAEPTKEAIEEKAVTVAKPKYKLITK